MAMDIRMPFNINSAKHFTPPFVYRQTPRTLPQERSLKENISGGEK